MAEINQLLGDLRAVLMAIRENPALQKQDALVERIDRAIAELKPPKLDELPEAVLTWRAQPVFPRTRELLRRFAAQWNESEADPKTREYVGPRFELLREVLAAFEAEDRGE